MPDINTLIFESLNSTSTYAAENADSLPMPSLIIANEQTAGRGRRGKSFFSPGGSGLYMTLVFNASDFELLTPCAAVAVCSALEELGAEPQIKWVNDVFIDGRKICGILTERFSRGEREFISIGIGINLTTLDFPEELIHAGSVGIACDKPTLAKEIARRILKYVECRNDEEIIDEYKKRLFILGKSIAYTKTNTEYTATVLGINRQCNLVVRRSDSTEEVLSSGEISIRF